MTKILRFVLLLFAFSAVGLWASAQSSGGGGNGSTATGSGTNSSSNSGANSQSGASVTYTNNAVSTVPPMLLGSVPGVAGETIPGQAVNNGNQGGFYERAYSVWTKDYMKAMSKGVSKKFVRYEVAEKLSAEERPVHLLTWWPEAGIWPGDRIIAVADVYGEPFHPSISYLAKALLELSEKSHSDRCAVAYQDMNELLTDNSAHGIGAQGSGTMLPGGNPTGMNAVLGWYHGRSTTGVVSYPHYKVECLNDGSFDVPPSLRPKPAPVIIRRPTRPAPIPVPPEPRPAPQPQPAPPVAAPATACEVNAPLHVFFAFDRSSVDPKYYGAIREAAEWIASHPGCRYEINGNADTVGTRNYNWALGGRRAQAVEKLMVKFGGAAVKDRVVITSSGKEYPSPVNAAASRRVILEVSGPGSGH